MGFSALAGAFGFMAKKATSKTPTAPPPTAVTPLDKPTPPIVDPSADQAAAVLAGQKVRKRAALGALATRPLAKPGQVAAKLAPKALIGGY